MKPVGGYFSLELPHYEEYHKDALRLNTGRNCLEYILRVRKYRKVYIPYYTCDVVLEPFQKLGIPYEYYHINIHLELQQVIQLREGEALLYTNYYGLKQRYTEILARRYGSQLIVDNTQAFYAKAITGIDTFYTCRKFFGVPDGAYLYTTGVLDAELEQDISYDRMIFLTKRIDLSAEAGYGDFHEQSKRLVGQSIKRMSNLTERMMQSIRYEEIASRRKDNFNLLHSVLGNANQLPIVYDDDAVPMVYPFFHDNKGIRDVLINNKVFVARYWPNVLQWVKSDTLEYLLAAQMLPLPIDQRYDTNDMEIILDILQKAER